MRKECLGARFRAASGIPRTDRGRKKGDREREKARQQNDSGRVRAFSPERKQKRVVERERARMSANADECG